MANRNTTEAIRSAATFKSTMVVDVGSKYGKMRRLHSSMLFLDPQNHRVGDTADFLDLCRLPYAQGVNVIYDYLVAIQRG